MPKSKNHTYAAEYPKTQLLFNIFIFYKKFTEGFLTTKDAFFEYFLIMQILKSKMELPTTAQKSIRFWKNILERLAKLVPLMPKSKNHTYAAEYPKTQLLFNIFIFYKKFTEGFLITKDAFFEYFLILQILKSKMELARTAQKSIRFWKNILERLAKLVPLMPKSKNHTYAAEYPKTQLLFNIFIFYKKFTEGVKK